MWRGLCRRIAVRSGTGVGTGTGVALEHRLQGLLLGDDIRHACTLVHCPDDADLVVRLVQRDADAVSVGRHRLDPIQRRQVRFHGFGDRIDGHRHRHATDRVLTELGQRADRREVAVREDTDPVTHRLDLREEVTGEEHRRAGLGLGLYQVAHLRHPLGVEATGGLVEHEQVGVADQRRRERQALAHSLRVLPGRPAPGLAVESDPVEQPLHVGLALFDPRGVLDVLAGRQPVVGLERLGQHTDPLADPSGFRLDVVTQHGRRPGVRVQKTQQHVDRRRLPGAVWPQKAEDLAALDGQIEPVDRGEVAKLLCESVRLDNCHCSSHLSLPQDKPGRRVTGPATLPVLFCIENPRLGCSALE